MQSPGASSKDACQGLEPNNHQLQYHHKSMRRRGPNGMQSPGDSGRDSSQELEHPLQHHHKRMLRKAFQWHEVYWMQLLGKFTNTFLVKKCFSIFCFKKCLRVAMTFEVISLCCHKHMLRRDPKGMTHRSSWQRHWPLAMTSCWERALNGMRHWSFCQKCRIKDWFISSSVTVPP